jgi:hypothetical protein
MRQNANTRSLPSNIASHGKRIALIACALVAIGPAAAQRDDVPLPPRLDRDPAPAAAAPQQPTASPLPPEIAGALATANRPPNSATLAPLPEERTDAPDEIIVIGRGWRLPDLGSAWRAKQQEKDGIGRFSATFLPFYDPDDPPPRLESPLLAPEARRVGYIELFRLRFGRRSPR